MKGLLGEVRVFPRRVVLDGGYLQDEVALAVGAAVLVWRRKELYRDGAHVYWLDMRTVCRSAMPCKISNANTPPEWEAWKKEYDALNDGQRSRVRKEAT